MEKFPLAPFTDPHKHEQVSEIIRKYSTNRADIRDIALAGLELCHVKDILDLGCGFGFMAGTVAHRVAPKARILGMDACSQNGPFFLNAVRSTGRDAEFYDAAIATALPWPDESFDLVLASYSLYFFPEIVPDIARVLRRDGTLVAITHSESSFAQMCDACGTTLSDAPLSHLIRRFSSENGHELLFPAFAQTRKIDYPNQLVFDVGALDELLEYTRFKSPLFFSRNDDNSDRICAAVEDRLRRNREFRLDKNDAVFHARKPRCH